MYLTPITNNKIGFSWWLSRSRCKSREKISSIPKVRNNPRNFHNERHLKWVNWCDDTLRKKKKKKSKGKRTWGCGRDGEAREVAGWGWEWWERWVSRGLLRHSMADSFNRTCHWGFPLRPIRCKRHDLTSWCGKFHHLILRRPDNTPPPLFHSRKYITRSNYQLTEIVRVIELHIYGFVIVIYTFLPTQYSFGSYQSFIYII